MKRLLPATALLCAFLFGFSFYSFSQTTLIAKKATWKYDDSNTAHNNTWTTDSFDDSGWTSDEGIFGYGTLTGASVDETLNSGLVTYYFRKTFTIADPHYTSLDINILCDDGFAIFINGQFVTKDNMPSSWSHNTTASTSINGNDEGDYDTYTVTTTDFNLVPGENVVAVEIHNQDATSSDIGFDLELKATAGTDNNYVLENGPYIQMATPTSQNIRWRTDGAHNARVFFGKSSTNLKYYADQSSNTTEHEVALTNLSPDTKYFYAIADSAGELTQQTDSNFFYTAPTVGGDDFSRIWVLGDCGRASSEQEDTRDAYYNYVGDGYTDGVILLGDNAYNTGTDSEFESKFFEYYDDKILRQTPLWPAPGNHDYGSASPSRSTNCAYYDLFTVPTAAEAGGVSSGTEQYYSFDHSNIHFLSLDSYGENGGDRMSDTSGNQAQWVKSDLAATSQLWRVAYWHHPPYTMGSHNSDTEQELEDIRENFMYLLDQYDVDLVLCGHSHNYERTSLIDGYYGNESSYSASTHALSTSSGRYNGTSNSCPYVKTPDDHEGFVYAVAGSASRKNSTQSAYPHDAMYFSESSNAGSLVLETEGTRMNVKFINENGVVQDSFTIMKNVNKTVTATVTNNDSLLLEASWVGDYNWTRASETSSSIKVDSTSTIYYVSDDNGCLRDTFVINGAEQVPVAVNDSKTIAKGDSTTYDVQFNDIDPNGNGLTTAIITQPDNGVASLSGDSIKYVPDTSFVGVDTLEYSICGNSLCDTALFIITVDSSSGNCEKWVAFNDMRNYNSPSHASYVTTIGYNNNSGLLTDSATSTNLAARFEGTYLNGLDPQASGANFSSGTDAYNWFNGICDLQGGFELDAANWDNIASFKGLDPNGLYDIILTYNRDNSAYNDRWTKVTIEGADSYTNASSSGVITYGGNSASVSINTGYNRLTGYVARWKDVSPGSDSAFSVKSEWLDTMSGGKGYAMTLFRLEQTCGSSSSGGSGSTFSSDNQVCWLIADASNTAYKVTLNSNIVLDSTSTAADPEASTLNLAGDTLWYIHQDDLYFIDLTASSLNDQLLNDDFDAIGLDGIKHGNNKNWTDYDAMTIDMQNRIWVGTKSAEGAMFVIDPATGNPIANFFGSGEDYMGVGMPTSGQFDCMAIDPLDGFIYANLNDGGGSTGDVLYRINPTNGDTVRIAKFSITDIEGMGFTGDGRLIATTGQNATNTSHNNQLWEIDINSGQIESVYSTPGSDVEACDCEIGLNVSLNEISGFVFDDVNADTIHNANEEGIEGVGVSIYRDVNHNSQYDYGTDTLYAIDTTNSNGYFYKRILYTGGIDSFIVTTTFGGLPAGYAFTTDHFESAIFTNGQNKEQLNNFGISDTSNKISGFVFADNDNDTVYSLPSGDAPTGEIDITLYRDINGNQKYDSGTDTLLETQTTDVFGYYEFRVYYTSGTDNFVIIVDSTDGILSGNMNTDNIEIASFTSGGNRDINNNYGHSAPTEACSGWVAFNDIRETGTNSSFVTQIGYDESGFLKDSALNTLISGATLVGSSTGGLAAEGNNHTLINGTDAYNWFNGVISPTNGFALTASNDTNTLTLNGLDPNSTYDIVLTHNRSDGNYSNRWTKVILEGADDYKNSSSSGVTAYGSNPWVSFCTGLNDVGYVARWTSIRPGTDSSFQVHSVWHDTLSSPKGYSMSIFRLEKECPGPNQISGYVFEDVNEDTIFQSGGSDNPTSDINVFLYNDVNGNGKYENSTDVLLQKDTTDASGYYSFSELYTSGTFNYLIVIDSTDGDLGGNMTTDIIEVASFSSSSNHDQNNNFGYFLSPSYSSSCKGWVAFNDIRETGTNANYVTQIGYDESGTLKDSALNNNIATVQMAGSSAGGLDPAGSGNLLVNGSDAYKWFNGIISPTNGFELDALNDTNTVTFSGLDPSSSYEIVLTYNRNNSGYVNRWTRVILGGTESATNESSSGVITYGANPWVSIRTGYNNNGYIARWTGISPGADSTFSVGSVKLDTTVGSASPKGYSMSIFRIQKECPADNIITGYVFGDVNKDSIYQNGNGDNPTQGVDIKLCRDVNANGKYDNSSDTLVDSETTNSSGYFKFKVPFGGGVDSFLVVADTSDGSLSGNMTTDNVELANFNSGGNTDDNNNSGFNPSPVPVTWLKFTGHWDNNDAVLNWSTASEQNSKEFILERKVDDGTFKPINSIDAVGFSNEIQRYSITDYNSRSANYQYFLYRLQQVDFDGSIDYSTVVLLRNDQELGSLRPLPVPFTNSLTIFFDAMSASEIDVTLTTLTGTEVYHDRYFGKSTNNMTLHNLGHLAPGVYFVNVKYDGRNKTIKVIK